MRREQAWEKQREKLSQTAKRALDTLISYLDHPDEKNEVNGSDKDTADAG